MFWIHTQKMDLTLASKKCILPKIVSLLKLEPKYDGFLKLRQLTTKIWAVFCLNWSQKGAHDKIFLKKHCIFGSYKTRCRIVVYNITTSSTSSRGLLLWELNEWWLSFFLGPTGFPIQDRGGLIFSLFSEVGWNSNFSVSWIAWIS